MTRPLVTPQPQSATFIELFFDLVFVFGITQMVYLFHHDLTWAGAGKAVLVFWMLWWAWTQFTWALNTADTTHPFVEFSTLAATAIAFFMAVAVPTVYEEGAALWFAVPYVGVRVVGLWLFARVASHNPKMRQAVGTFSALSIGGLATALMGAYLGGAAQVPLWGMTILLDVVAAMNAGNEEGWEIHPEHFAERHGLIVIIALGESLIVAAAGLVGGSTFETLVVLTGAAAVLLACALWWTYFPVAKPELEHALEAATGERRGKVARDSFSIGHFPMLCGVIAYAVGLEDALAHPDEPLSTAARLAVALGIFLFVGGTAFAMWRAACGKPVERLVIATAAGTAVFFSAGILPVYSLSIALAGAGLVAFRDERKAQRLKHSAA